LQKLLSAATPRRKRGKVFGFASTANSAGVMLSTIVAGGAMWVDGVRGVFLAAALLTLLLMPGYYLVLKIIMHQRYFASQYKKILGK
jgi:MFS family permease